MKTCVTLRLVVIIIMATSCFALKSNAAPTLAQPRELPVRALMLNGLQPAALESFLQFVKTELVQEGVTHLIFQIDYNYEFKSRPEMISAPSFSEAQIKALVRTCRAAGIKLIPLVNCLGHQSWAQTTHRLLIAHPELDETPGLFPENKEIYCRSYCPNHPEVHPIIFDLLGEIASVFEADAIHVGMDEVFLIGEESCLRCQGIDKAELFAQEVRTLRNFLTSKGLRLWLWGDRLLDGASTGLGKWEASMNNTHRAIDLIPKDVVVCDWHYEASPPTAAYFAMKGFDVVMCSWNRPEVAEEQADMMVQLRMANRENKLGARLLGVMATNWGESAKFAESYRRIKAGEPAQDKSAVESFIHLFARARKLSSEGSQTQTPASSHSQ